MIILSDNSEKMPWDFSFYSHCTGQEEVNLNTGDYTLKGFEEILVIERKRNSGEIAINLGQKWKAFLKEFQRMEVFTHKYLICEFPFDDLLKFPVNSGIPKHLWSKIRINGKFLASRLTKTCEEYGVELIFTSGREEAQSIAMNIFQEVYANKK
jgi:hypothetical protein